ncbi:MAG: ATP-binding protein [Candidatus Paceibacterota bacterium]
MNFIQRQMQKRIEDSLFKGKIVVIYGARQVGKTTIVKHFQEKYPDSVYLNCDEPDVREALTDASSVEIKSFIGDKKLVFLDEAQRVKNIGLSLKLIVENFPEIQVVATGSSSFDLSNQISEPLTGRKYEFLIYPFSMQELSVGQSEADIDRSIENRMIFGMYPEVATKSGEEQKEALKSIAKSYLYKDVLQYQNIKNPDVLEKLLQALALQMGNEVSYGELAEAIRVDKKTVINYIDILEKAFIIFQLKPFSRNLRNELKKLRKIYFFDNGIRNALVNNFNPISLRQDVGSLWENFMISERVKFNNNNNIDNNIYFWRTHDKKEIDYIEDRGGKLYAFEFKWKKDKTKEPKTFLEAYQNSKFEVINSDNYQKFVL